MKTELINPIVLSEQQLTDLSKLMLNSWSAEYALRITPLVKDEQALKASRKWVFPQAFYAGFFSIRAVLITLDCPTYSELSALAASQVLHKFGLYEGTTLRNNFLHVLGEYRYGHGLNDPLVTHAQLVDTIQQMAVAHETHLIDVIGYDAYAELVALMPSYIQDSFLFDRFACLPTPSDLLP